MARGGPPIGQHRRKTRRRRSVGIDMLRQKIDQLADGTYRLTPKAVPGGNVTMALSAIGASSPTLERVDANTDRQRWLLRTP